MFDQLIGVEVTVSNNAIEDAENTYYGIANIQDRPFIKMTSEHYGNVVVTEVFDDTVVLKLDDKTNECIDYLTFTDGSDMGRWAVADVMEVCVEDIFTLFTVPEKTDLRVDDVVYDNSGFATLVYGTETKGFKSAIKQINEYYANLDIGAFDGMPDDLTFDLPEFFNRTTSFNVKNGVMALNDNATLTCKHGKLHLESYGVCIIIDPAAGIKRDNERVSRYFNVLYSTLVTNQHLDTYRVFVDYAHPEIYYAVYVVAK